MNGLKVQTDSENEKVSGEEQRDLHHLVYVSCTLMLQGPVAPQQSEIGTIVSLLYTEPVRFLSW